MTKRKFAKKHRLSQYSPYKIGLAVIATLIVGGLIYLMFIHDSDTSGYNGTQITTADGKKVDLSPANSSDKQANDSNKQAIVNRDNQLNGSSSQSPQAQLIITEVTASAVKAYVAGVFEDGGTCTATAAQGSQNISATSQGFENVSYTQCAPLNWQSPLGRGSWSVKVNYKSSTAEASATKTIQL